MFNITPSEFLIIAVLALVVLGPDRLPDMARSLGRLINKAREMTADLRDSVDSISDDPSMKPLKDLGELATRPRQKLAEFAAEAEAEDRAARLARQRAEADRKEREDADDGVNDSHSDQGATEDVGSDETADDEGSRSAVDDPVGDSSSNTPASTDPDPDLHDDRGEE